MKILSKVVKIKNSDKRISKTFDSADLALCYIKENEIQPAHNCNIFIEEVITYKAETLIDFQMSTANKQIILDLLRETIPDKARQDFYVAPDLYYESHCIYSKYKHKTSGSAENKMIEFLLNNTELTETDFLNYIAEIPFTNKVSLINKVHEICTPYAMVFFKYVLENTVEDFTFYRTSTDYKPCNAIILQLKSKMYNYCIQIRDQDVLLTNHEVYGRKVNLRKTHKLFDADVNHEFIKKLKSRANKN